MNERINELAEQATEYATFRHPVSNIVLAVERDKFEQKFAELIVRECAELANEETSLPYNSYSEKIRKHFGVEE
jgi:hypothetical protein